VLVNPPGTGQRGAVVQPNVGSRLAFFDRREVRVYVFYFAHHNLFFVVNHSVIDRTCRNLLQLKITLGHTFGKQQPPSPALVGQPKRPAAAQKYATINVIEQQQTRWWGHKIIPRANFISPGLAMVHCQILIY